MDRLQPNRSLFRPHPSEEQRSNIPSASEVQRYVEGWLDAKCHSHARYVWDCSWASLVHNDAFRRRKPKDREP